eukprot:2330407-Prymnesium_polylepis.1
MELDKGSERFDTHGMSGQGPHAREQGSDTCSRQSSAKSTRFFDAVGCLVLLSPPNCTDGRARGEVSS